MPQHKLPSNDHRLLCPLQKLFASSLLTDFACTTSARSGKCVSVCV